MTRLRWGGGLALILSAPLLLGACASGIPVEREVVVSGARFSAVQGEARLNIRSFVENSEGSLSELSGAVCSVETSLYSAELKTPSRLVLPNFGPQSPELRIACDAHQLTGTARTQITTYNVAPSVGYGPGFPGYGPGGFYGHGRYGYGWAYPAGGALVSRYPDTDVLLE